MMDDDKVPIGNGKRAGVGDTVWRFRKEKAESYVVTKVVEVDPTLEVFLCGVNNDTRAEWCFSTREEAIRDFLKSTFERCRILEAESKRLSSQILAATDLLTARAPE
jgi:hypothetical protein